MIFNGMFQPLFLFDVLVVVLFLIYILIFNPVRYLKGLHGILPYGIDILEA